MAWWRTGNTFSMVGQFNNAYMPVSPQWVLSLSFYIRLGLVSAMYVRYSSSYLKGYLSSHHEHLVPSHTVFPYLFPHVHKKSLSLLFLHTQFLWYSRWRGWYPGLRLGRKHLLVIMRMISLWSLFQPFRTPLYYSYHPYVRLKDPQPSCRSTNLHAEMNVLYCFHSTTTLLRTRILFSGVALKLSVSSKQESKIMGQKWARYGSRNQNMLIRSSAGPLRRDYWFVIELVCC